MSDRVSYPDHQYRDKEGNIVCNWMQDDYECKAPESREGGMCLYATDEVNQCPINILEAVKTILVNHSEDDPCVGEAYTLQEVADELGVEKGFSIEKLRKLLDDSQFNKKGEK